MSQRRRRRRKTAHNRHRVQQPPPIAIHIIIRVIVPHIMETVNKPTEPKRMEIIAIIIIIIVTISNGGAMVIDLNALFPFFKRNKTIVSKRNPSSLRCNNENK